MKKFNSSLFFLLLVVLISRVNPAFGQITSPQGVNADILDYSLPFQETWDSGTFSFQQWTGEGNWICKTSAGDPAPSADFTRQPVMTGYSTSLISAEIDATGWSCAKIWLDFDYKLEDVTASGTEQLYVEVMWDSVWHPGTEFVNNGSTGWISTHLDISAAMGKIIRVRFRANGTTTANILNWYVDNINLYGVGDPPEDLQGWQSNNSVHLTWYPPPCFQAGQTMCFIFDDGSEENGWGINPGYTFWLGNLFPVSSSCSGLLQSFELLWYDNPAATNQNFQIDVFSLAGILIGSSQTFPVPIPAPSTFMVVDLVDDIPFSGPFYGMVKWNSFTGATHYLGYDENGPYALQQLGYYYDGSGFGTIQIGNPGVFTERACGFLYGDNKLVKERTNDTDSSLLNGYNVYRYDSVSAGVIPFRKINPDVITGLSYTDLLDQDSLQYGIYMYYVTAVVNNSATGQFLYESEATDTLNIQFPAVGIRELKDGSISIFPNPANDFVTVKSDFKMDRIELWNFSGMEVYNQDVAGLKSAKIITSSFPAGVYLIRISTSRGIRNAKITIIR
jgi:hypothetical protein